MKLVRKIFHPFIAFIGIQLVWLLLVILWIYWFLGRNKEFQELAEKYKTGIAAHTESWFVLAQGIILLLLMLAGVYVIFLFWRRQSDLYKQQKNAVSQITHELKSPLASIQLHLETIRLRKLSQDKIDRFIETMLSDIDRLNNLISNLLTAAKLEQRRRPKHRQVIDFSSFVCGLMEQKRKKLPEGGMLNLDIEKGLRVSVNEEDMESVLRNLFENSLIYSQASPEITLKLQREGKYCLLTFEDCGKGLQPKELKKVFQMFYRARQPGENIRGSGLGLYIVKTIVGEHGGRVTVTSPGIGKGTAFHIWLPLAR